MHNFIKKLKSAADQTENCFVSYSTTISTITKNFWLLVSTI